jgi:hypothetical protein
MRKAQIQMFETIGVLVVFFFLLVASAAFYFKFQESALKKELAKQAQLQSLQTAQRAMFLPELDCSFVSVQRENCFDRYKLVALQDVAAQDSRMEKQYFGLFGYANVSVRQVYPATSFHTTIYARIPEEYHSVLKSFAPVLLYDPLEKSFSFGVMEVATYALR